MNYFSLIVASTLLAFFPSTGPAVEEKDLEEAQVSQPDKMAGASSIAISDDGKFLYCAAFQSGSVYAFKRDLDTGQLVHFDTYSGPHLRGAVRVRLSRDGEYAVTSAFATNTVTVFKRDTANGGLVIVDKVSDAPNGGTGVDFVVDAAFSSDSRFIYTACSGGVGVFGFEGKKLAFVQYEEGESSLKGVRGCMISPDGKSIYAPAYRTGTLAVLHRDDVTGRLQTVQTLTNGQDGVSALKGAFRAAVTGDGKHVYVSGGRFGGDQAISAFEVQPDGELKLVQEFVDGKDGFNDFEGGNEIKVSPDGKSVFAVASISDRLFRFSRDTVTGRLTLVGSQTVASSTPPGAAGLCFSPDGKFVYVTEETLGSIVVFKIP